MASSLPGSKASGIRLRIDSFGLPWNIPQSMRIWDWPAVSRNWEPVTVVAAPRNCSSIVIPGVCHPWPYPRRSIRQFMVHGISPARPSVSTSRSPERRNADSATTSRSPKPAPGDDVRGLSQERLIEGIPPTQGEEVDPADGEIELGPDQPVRPMTVDVDAMAEDGDATRLGRPPEEDDLATWRVPRLDRSGRERLAGRGGLDPDRRAPLGGLDPPLRSPLQGSERRFPEAGPDLRLPAAVERLDRRLEAGLVGWREDGHDAECQTQPDHRSDRVGFGQPADEPRVVVELGIGRQAERAPALEQRRNNLAHSHPEARPGARQPAVEADRGQDSELGLPAQIQTLDDVEAVELTATTGHVGQIPPGWWRRASDPTAAIEGAAAVEDTADRANRRERPPQVGPLEQRAVDRGRSVLAEDARFAQLPAKIEDQILETWVDPREAVPGRRPVRPIHPVQPLVGRPLEPQLDGREADAERPGNGPLRLTRPHRGDHLTPARRPSRARFSPTSTLLQPVSFHTTDRDVVALR